MRIISKFRDFYDTIMSQGVDMSVVYLRERKEIGEMPTVGSVVWHTGKHGKQYGVYSGVLGYCGELLPFVAIMPAGIHESESVCFDTETFERRCFMLGLRSTRRWFWSGSSDMLDDKARAKHFDKTSHSGLLKLFGEHKTPLFVQYRKGLVVNPSLKDLEFQRVKDPFTTFQDVYMYVAGVLGSQKPLSVELTDQERADKKGHGGKMSFRKPPGKRGKPQWR